MRCQVWIAPGGKCFFVGFKREVLESAIGGTERFSEPASLAVALAKAPFFNGVGAAGLEQTR